MNELSEHNELPDTGRSSRILVALDSSLRNLNALEDAAALASLIRAELVALLIEDVNLVHLAALPFAREVDCLSAVARQFDSLRLNRALRIKADRVRQVLDRSALRRQLRASLRVVRGHFVAEALSAAAAMDVVFLVGMGGTELISVHHAGAAMGNARKAAGRDRVLVLYDGSPAAGRALTAGCHLSQSLGRDLVVLLTGISGKPSALREAGQAIVGALGLSARFIVIPASDAAGLLAVSRSERCGLLVLSRDLLERDDEIRLLGLALCPVVLVS